MRRLDIVEQLAQYLETLDWDATTRDLIRRVQGHSPIAVELLAYENLRSPTLEAQRVAAIQLRVLRSYAAELRWLAALSESEPLRPSTRAAIGHLLAELSDLPGSPGSPRLPELLESAFLYHALFAKLRPWLPPVARAFEHAEVLDLLALALEPARQTELRPRFEALWAMFHRVIQLPSTKLALLDGARPDRLARTIKELALERIEIAPAPPWNSPSWAMPWLAGRNAPLRALASNSAPDLRDVDSTAERAVALLSLDCG
ncbi:hypothetical protein PPSIR1_40315 [Plesiocystis pacifica SIR-1]|uniref:Uncharacterized protein n=1 Tax=Plesiocystis pacifica SIR-1 TaxID=391625 RepID=A6FYJ3_9BACT|nr:hypothetical protein [Plesiocystis pacifica]EDM81265.1 hypothetical protein PPSIR1_40315 [Plesiocystis pacifica SIR-1]